MAKTYQAQHFTGEQLDTFMKMVNDGSIVGRGMEIDENGVLQCTVPGYTKRVFSYTHTGNLEVHPTALDCATGVFTAPGHGLELNTVLIATLHHPYNLGNPYDYLPSGLSLGGTGNFETATKYYAQPIDEDTFTLSSNWGYPGMEGNEPTLVTFTERNTMDLSKWHFEEVKRCDFEIAELDLRECLFVLRGKVLGSYRWVVASNRLTFGTNGNKTGGIAFDTAYGADAYGSCNLGRPGYNYTHATVEFKMIDEHHMHQTTDVSYVVYASTGSPTFKHVRQYFFMRMDDNCVKGISMYGDDGTWGGFFNGTTVEVYAK